MQITQEEFLSEVSGSDIREDFTTLRCELKVVNSGKSYTNEPVDHGAQRLLDDLKDLWQSIGTNDNVTYIVKSDRYQAHKSILSARSCFLCSVQAKHQKKENQCCYH